jgi:hypothetical protein
MARLLTCRCGSAIATNRRRAITCGHCGHVHTADDLPPRILYPRTPPPSAELPCIHRGAAVDSADCPCQGDTRVYTCDIHHRAQIHRLAPGLGPKAVCDRCPDRTDPAGVAAIITTHWNPAGFAALRRTYLNWLPTVGHPVHCIELAFDHSPAELPGATVIRGDASQVLWQKERATNLAIHALPPWVRLVAWIDHDIILTRPDWLAEAAARITAGAHAVQLFDRIRYLDADGSTLDERPSATAVLAAGGRPGTAPGGAWMASRDWLTSIGGLYDASIVGGGDATFFAALTKSDDGHTRRQTPRLRDHARRYIDRITDARWDFVPGLAVHLWHGDRSRRQYVTRDDILARHDFDPTRHIEPAPNGLWRWTSAAPRALLTDVAAYFAARAEDTGGKSRIG